MAKQLRIALTLLCFFFQLFTPTALAVPPHLWKHWARHDEQSKAIIDHSLWQQFLNRTVQTGPRGQNLIDYAHIDSHSRGLLNEYLNQLATTKITHYNRKAQLAYWINLYNALVVKTIVEHYPVSSIQEINISPGHFVEGPWKADIIHINTTTLNLNDIENRILRPIWKDPRILFALSKGSLGSPGILKQAFTGYLSDELLTQATQHYINQPQGVRIEKDKLIVSTLFREYPEDFGRSDHDIIAFIKRYAKPELKAKLEKFNTINNTEFNWALNQVPKPQRKTTSQKIVISAD